ncbi:MAG: M6 family metalloprotease domain-containing protein [Muribaculaceae bacterium]|nr:M6 family metalloprotease domain-containing protein [Muribaculaceae bacterium]
MNIKQLILSGAIFATFAASAPLAMAVPAYRGPVTVTQADGTTITVVNHGDEWAHYTTTVDNHLLLDVDGVFEYGILDASGKVVSSGVKATNLRPAAERSFLSTLDAEKIVETRGREVYNATAAKRAQFAERFRSFTVDSEKRRVAPTTSGMLVTNFPSTGKQKAIVILVEYKDIKFKTTDAHNYFDRMLNEKGFSDFGSIGSAHDYFLDASTGQFDCDFDLYGPVTLPYNRSYYGANDIYGQDRNAHLMAVHACEALDATVDFTQYDRDNDGVIDNVFIFYAGEGEATTGPASSVWPHSWDVRYAGENKQFDGKTLGNYACSNEWESMYPDGARADGIGTFVHEFSHVIGLPDLYATNNTYVFTPREWTVLDYGSYNYNGLIPSTYTAFERISMGWINPTVLTGRADVTLKEISSNEAYIIPTNLPNEYFVLENRQKKGFDRELPYHGMLIWHIDYLKSAWTSNSVNNAANHQRVDLVEANNQTAETTSMTEGRRGNPFPGIKRVREFTSETTPALKTWSGQAIDLPITDITETNGVITFKVAGGLLRLDPVTFRSATNVTPRSFTVNWNSVEGADNYVVTVTVDGNIVKGYDKLEVGNVNSVDVTGLEPTTTYAVTVAAYDENRTSYSESEAPLTVTTSELTFDYVIPTAYVSGRTETETTLTWKAVDGANSYFIDLFSQEHGESKDVFLDFADGYAYLPAGWKTTCTKNYESSIFSSVVPALCFSVGDYIESPVFPGDIKSVSFWCRTQSNGTSNKIDVEFLVNGEWKTGSSPNAPQSKTTMTIEAADIPTGARAVRITYSGTGDATLALDDVKVTYFTESVRNYFGVYHNYSVGNVTSLNVTGLDPSTEYLFTVRGHNGSVYTLPSAETAIVFGSGISDIERDKADIQVRYYNLQGVEVKNPVTGHIYIRVSGGKAEKVIVR